MRFKKVGSFLTNIDDENPKVVHASLKRAEKYLHNRVVLYLENNEEDDLAKQGNRLINLLHSASDTIHEATDDEIEFMVGDIKSKVKHFDKRMRQVVVTPTVPTVKSAGTKDVDFRRFTEKMGPKIRLRKPLEIIKVPIVFRPTKSHLYWHKHVKEIRKYFKLGVYDNYPILQNQYAMFISKDFGRYSSGIDLIPNNLDPINRGYPGMEQGSSPITYNKKYEVQWCVTASNQKMITKYFGKVLSWSIADGTHSR